MNWGLNRSLRKIIKTRGSFPNDDAALKVLYLAIRNAAPTASRARELLAVPTPQEHNADADAVNPNEPPNPSHPCPC
jgi:transposase-like protein